MKDILRKHCIPMIAGAALSLAATAGQTQSIVSSGQSYIQAELLPGKRQSDGGRLAGLRLRLEPGWKTYWRSPGETGVPPAFDWGGSQNIASLQILWPRPEVFESFGLETVGYADEVVLPVRIVPTDAEAPISVVLQADLGVCREICLFEQIALETLITSATNESGASLIEHFNATVPAPGDQRGLSSLSCRISGTGRDRDLSAALLFNDTLRDPRVLIEGGAGLWIHDVQSESGPEGISLTAKLSLLNDVLWIDRSAIRMTVLAEGFSADIRGCQAPKT